MSKRLRISGPFIEKSGNPEADNLVRNANRTIQRGTRESIKIHARSRKRRRQLFHIEGDHYQHLVAETMNALIRERAEQARPNMQED